MKDIVIATLVISAVAVVAFAIIIGIRMYGKNKASPDTPQQQPQTPAPDKAEQPTPQANAEQTEEQ